MIWSASREILHLLFRWVIADSASLLRYSVLATSGRYIGAINTLFPVGIPGVSFRQIAALLCESHVLLS